MLSENDGMAGGVVAALEAQGLAGKVPVSGQDGDQAALNRVALGTQTVDVWKDARELGKAAGEAAVAAVQGHRRHQGGRHRAVHDPRWRRADVDPAQAAPDHQGQPQRRHRRRLDRPRTTLCKGVAAGSVPAAADRLTDEPAASARRAPRPATLRAGGVPRSRIVRGRADAPADEKA